MPKRRLPSGGTQSQVALEPEVAIAAIAIFSAYADGDDVNEDESYALDEMLSGIGLYEEYSDEDLQELGAKVGAMVREDGADAVFAQAIESLSDHDLKETAFIVAMVVLAIDGEVPEAEEEYLEDLRLALKISDDRAQELVDELFSEDEESEEDEESGEDEE
jgi:hypothetical protein